MVERRAETALRTHRERSARETVAVVPNDAVRKGDNVRQRPEIVLQA